MDNGTIVETNQQALDRGVATIRRNYENTAKRGRLTLDAVEQRMASAVGAETVALIAASLDRYIAAIVDDSAAD